VSPCVTPQHSTRHLPSGVPPDHTICPPPPGMAQDWGPPDEVHSMPTPRNWDELSLRRASSRARCREPLLALLVHTR